MCTRKGGKKSSSRQHVKIPCGPLRCEKNVKRTRDHGKGGSPERSFPKKVWGAGQGKGDPKGSPARGKFSDQKNKKGGNKNGIKRRGSRSAGLRIVVTNKSFGKKKNDLGLF